MRAVDTGDVGAAVDTSAGDGRDTDAVDDLARATSDELGLQLLQRNMSLQRALKQSRKELDRHVCVYVTSYALCPPSPFLHLFSFVLSFVHARCSM